MFGSVFRESGVVRCAAYSTTCIRDSWLPTCSSFLVNLELALRSPDGGLWGRRAWFCRSILSGEDTYTIMSILNEAR